MGLEMLKNSQKTIGTKQTMKAVEKGTASCVFIAADAEKRVVLPLTELCSAKGIPVEEVATMRLLGDACEIDVGTASAAVLRN